MSTQENFDLAKAVARRDKLRGKYNRSGLSNTDCNELLRLDKAIEQEFKLLIKLKNSLSELAQKYRAEAHELSLIRDFEKSQMYSHFGRELENLNKGGD